MNSSFEGIISEMQPCQRFTAAKALVMWTTPLAYIAPQGCRCLSDGCGRSCVSETPVWCGGSLLTYGLIQPELAYCC